MELKEELQPIDQVNKDLVFKKIGELQDQLEIRLLQERILEEKLLENELMLQLGRIKEVQRLQLEVQRLQLDVRLEVQLDVQLEVVQLIVLKRRHQGVEVLQLYREVKLELRPLKIEEQQPVEELERPLIKESNV